MFATANGGARAATSVASAPRPLRATPSRHPGAPCHHHHAVPIHALRRPRLAVLASTTDETSSSSSPSSSRFYFNFTGFPFPLGPFLNRRTTRTEAVKGSVWLFEQEQVLGFSSVSTNTRMTVVKLRSDGLWVHAPIAPTKECIQAGRLGQASVSFCRASDTLRGSCSTLIWCHAMCS